MPFDNDDHEDGVSRRHALQRMVWASAGALCMVSGGVSKSWSRTITVQAATAAAQTKPTIPIIVKDKTSLYWQVLLHVPRLSIHVGDGTNDLSSSTTASTSAADSSSGPRRTHHQQQPVQPPATQPSVTVDDLRRLLQPPSGAAAALIRSLNHSLWFC